MIALWASPRAATPPDDEQQIGQQVLVPLSM